MTKEYHPKEPLLMPQFSNELPTSPQRFALPILRTPASKPLDAIITSPDMIVCPTHFVHNRTIPCEGVNDCPHCAEGHSFRFHAYVSCLVLEGLQHCIFEMTKRAAEQFKPYRDIYSTLRACHFIAWRPSKRFNARIVIKCKRHDELEKPIPDPPDIKRILCHLWNVQYKPDTDRLDPDTGGRLHFPAPANGDGRYRPTIHTEPD